MTDITHKKIQNKFKDSENVIKSKILDVFIKRLQTQISIKECQKVRIKNPEIIQYTIIGNLYIQNIQRHNEYTMLNLVKM